MLVLQSGWFGEAITDTCTTKRKQFQKKEGKREGGRRLTEARNTVYEQLFHLQATHLASTMNNPDLTVMTSSKSSLKTSTTVWPAVFLRFQAMSLKVDF